MHLFTYIFLKNESKPKPVVHGHKCEIEDIVDDLINEVIRSTEYEPCVLSVVCDAIKDIIILEDDDDQNETSVYDMYDVTDIQLEVDDVIDKVCVTFYWWTPFVETGIYAFLSYLSTALPITIISLYTIIIP